LRSGQPAGLSCLEAEIYLPPGSALPGTTVHEFQPRINEWTLTHIRAFVILFVAGFSLPLHDLDLIPGCGPLRVIDANQRALPGTTVHEFQPRKNEWTPIFIRGWPLTCSPRS